MQRALQSSLANQTGLLPEKDEKRWAIRDFITMGSPLAHAELLMSQPDASFRDAVENRRFPASPALTQKYGENRGGLTYKSSKGGVCHRSMHHGAVFASVSWTGWYFENDIFGGPIAGPIMEIAASEQPGLVIKEPALRGVLSMPLGCGSKLRPSLMSFARFYSHSSYWRPRATDPKVIEDGREKVLVAVRKLTISA